ncbi:hypothetical protein D9758_014006 [Tetrapyrgos nigripes]|uniref:Uncharacterized protein n=1 Tax=Tetrapyrgos nigripes TaxID=182062 RepID=A0A8H5CYC5_9AGAR|nr:hypothetical protein D9758_014006 [Tetrapyrgos nigripes]
MQDIKILQMNTHKSKTATFDLINEDKDSSYSDNYDIICIQEPWRDAYGNARQNYHWTMVYLYSRPVLGREVLLCSIILVNKRIPTGSWQTLEIPDTNDINIVVDVGTLEENVQALKTFMDMNGGFAWALAHNCNFALDKFIVIHFPHPRNGPTPKAPPLSLRDTTVKETESVCVLGVMLDSQLKWKVQQASALGEATSIVSALWRITWPSQGVSLKMIRRLYISVVILKMTYGLDVWYTPPHCPEGGQKRVGSVSALHGLEKVHRQALLSITGAMRSAPTDLLETHANLLPMRYLLEKICYRSLIRIFSLPDNHPIRKMASNAYQHRNTTTHSPPLQTLSRLFDPPAPSDVETITPLAHPPDYDVLFSCDIPPDKDQVYTREENNRRRINIYSDGSRIDSHAGAAAVLLDKQNPANNQVLQHQLSALKLHTTYEAEGIGVVLRLALLQNCLHTNQDNTNMIGLDSKSFIEATFNFKHRPRQYIIDEIH